MAPRNHPAQRSISKRVAKVNKKSLAPKKAPKPRRRIG